MRILYATYSLAFQNPGGGERVLQSLRHALIAAGHQVDLFNPWFHRAKDYEVIHFFSTLESSFWEYAKRSAPAVPLIVTPTIHVPEGWRATLAVAKRKGLELLDERTGLEVNRWKRFELPDLWTPVTAAEAHGLQEYWGVGRERITVVPNGVDARFASADGALFRERTGITGPFVLHVARFDPVKNQLGLIEAARRARLHCVFIGDRMPVHAEYYELCHHAAHEAELADASGATKLTFLPSVAHDDPFLASAYAAAGVVALPSRFETFGLTALEGAMAGAPIVMTRNCYSRDLFEPISRLVDPDDSEEIARALREALAEGRSHEAARRRRTAVEPYSWDAIAARFVTLYEQARRRGGPGSPR